MFFLFQITNNAAAVVAEIKKHDASRPGIRSSRSVIKHRLGSFILFLKGESRAG